MVLCNALLAVVYCAPAVSAQQPPAAMGGVPQIPKVELSEDSAKRAVDTYLTLREKYGDKMPPAKGGGSLGEGAEQAAEIQSVVTGNGFSNTEDWQNTITNVALAYGFSKNNKGGEIDAKIAELRDNTQLPKGIRDQLVRTMTAMRPSENNMKVVESLAADSSYGAKLAEISK